LEFEQTICIKVGDVKMIIQWCIAGLYVVAKIIGA